MVASDNGDDAATKELAELYRADPALTFDRPLLRHSPAGGPRRLDGPH